MIKADISTVVFLYILLSVVVVLIAWLFLDFGTKLKTYSSDEKYIWHCNICVNTYIDSKSGEISKCPRCGSYIEKKNIFRTSDSKRQKEEK